MGYSLLSVFFSFLLLRLVHAAGEVQLRIGNETIEQVGSSTSIDIEIQYNIPCRQSSYEHIHYMPLTSTKTYTIGMSSHVFTLKL
jgi:hypothetical protein